MSNPQGKWVTIKGRHVFLKDGESVNDAVNRTIALENERIRERQIAANRNRDELIIDPGSPEYQRYLEGLKATDSINDVLFLSGDRRLAGNLINDLTKSGDVFVFKDDGGEVRMFGKTYNDEYYPFNFRGKGVAQTKMDSDDMAKEILDSSGNSSWSLSKYSGEVQWTEKKRDRYDTGNRSAVILPELPTDAKAKKRAVDVKGYDIYDISDGPKFFSRVAIRRV